MDDGLKGKGLGLRARGRVRKEVEGGGSDR